MAKKKKKSSKGAGKIRALAPRPSTPPARTGKRPRGLEQVERKDILMPRLKLLQPLNPEVTGELKMDVGTILNNLTGKNYGKAITIVPILHFRSRIKWIPKDDGGGIDCQSPDAVTPREDKYAKACADCKWKEWDEKAKKKKDKAPKCTLYDNFIVLVNGESQPVVLPFERSKAPVARKFYSMAALKNLDLWCYRYSLTTFQDHNDNDEPFHNYIIADAGPQPDKAVLAAAEQLYEALHGKAIAPDESEQGESGAGAAPKGGKEKF